MEDPNSTLLPYILETLSRKPELCDTFDNICTEIEGQLIADNNTRYGNVRNALQRALTVGQSLGIITLTNETIRMPFNFRANAAKNATTANQPVLQPAIGTGNPTSITQNATDRSCVPSKTPYRKLPGPNTRSGNSEFMFGPPMRPRKLRGRPRGRSCARKTTGGRYYSRSRSGRGRKRSRSGYGRRVFRRR